MPTQLTPLTPEDAVAIARIAAHMQAIVKDEMLRSLAQAHDIEHNISLNHTEGAWSLTAAVPDGECIFAMAPTLHEMDQQLIHRANAKHN